MSVWPSKMIVITGGGAYPRLVVEGAHAAGVRQVDVLAVRGSTARETRRLADTVHTIGIGEIHSGLQWCAAQGYDGAVFAGQISPLSLFRSRFDAQTKAWLASLPCKNAHTVYGKLAEEFEKAGIPVFPASIYMDRNMPGEGTLTRRSPDAREMRDIAHAAAVAHDVGVHDVGQTVAVKDGMVLAVEAFEGTNAAIRRDRSDGSLPDAKQRSEHRAVIHNKILERKALDPIPAVQLTQSSQLVLSPCL